MRRPGGLRHLLLLRVCQVVLRQLEIRPQAYGLTRGGNGGVPLSEIFVRGSDVVVRFGEIGTQLDGFFGGADTIAEPLGLMIGQMTDSDSSPAWAIAWPPLPRRSSGRAKLRGGLSAVIAHRQRVAGRHLQRVGG